MAKAETAKKMSMSQGFRNSLKVKTLKTDEAVIAYVSKESGKTFTPALLKFYKAQHALGKL